MRMFRFRLLTMILGLGLLVGIWGCGSKASANGQAAEQPLIKPGRGLFRTHEFRSSLKALPQWIRVMEAADDQSEAFLACDPDRQVCSAAALSWQKILRQAAQLPPQEQLRAVNRFFNRWPYRLDIDVYGQTDYWATPEEFLRLSGDCEDYSITKYYALRNLGFPAEALRIVLLRDTIRNIPHAVLAVKLDGQFLILDNMSDLVLPHEKYQHYVPQYSVNEFYRWAHVSPKSVY